MKIEMDTRLESLLKQYKLNLYFALLNKRTELLTDSEIETMFQLSLDTQVQEHLRSERL